MLFQRQLAGRVNQCSIIYSSIVTRSSAVSAHAPVCSCAACVTPARTAVSCRKLNTRFLAADEEILISRSVRELSPYEWTNGKSPFTTSQETVVKADAFLTVNKEAILGCRSILTITLHVDVNGYKHSTGNCVKGFDKSQGVQQPPASPCAQSQPSQCRRPSGMPGTICPR